MYIDINLVGVLIQAFAIVFVAAIGTAVIVISRRRQAGLARISVSPKTLRGKRPSIDDINSVE